MKRPAIYDEWEREQKLEEVRNKYLKARNNQKPQHPPKPARNQTQQERPQPQEERKTGSILDRIKLRSDREDKKTISTAKSTTKAQPEEKLTKKIKPNPEE